MAGPLAGVIHTAQGLYTPESSHSADEASKDDMRGICFDTHL